MGIKKQKIVALSTTEAEFVAACEATKEIIWIKRLVSELTCKKLKEAELRIDNQSTIRLIKNPDVHKKSKHIDIKFYFIREKYGNKEIVLKHVNSNAQEADVFTKPLGKQRFQTMRELIGVQEIM